LLSFGIRVQTEWQHQSFHLTRASVARRLGITVRSLRVQLKVLSEAGLHGYLGWCADLYNVKHKLDQVGVVPKRAFAVPERNNKGELVAPDQLVRWARERMKARENWGGYRRGRHRLKLRRRFVERLEVIELFSPQRPTVESRRETQVCPPNERSFFSLSTSEILRISSVGRGRPFGLIREKLSQKIEMKIPEDSRQFELKPPEHPRHEFFKNLVGQKRNGADRQADILRLGQRLIPPYPGEQLVPTVRIPAPPCLPRNSTPAETVRVLATNYRGTLLVKFGKISRFLLQGAPEGHRNYGMLLRAAELLTAEGIPPATWCLFSADVWRKYHDGPVPPAFVFAATRILESRDWFESTAAAQYLGGAVRYASEHRKLLADHQRMWHELLWAAPSDRSGVIAIVDVFFPGREFEDRVSLARMQARKIQIQIDQGIAEGAMLWGR
jgi:hypothetical protein